MRKLLSVLALSSAIALTACGTKHSAQMTDAASAKSMASSSAIKPITETTTPGWENLDQIVQRGIDENVYPGAVLVVGHPDHVIWAKAYGHYTYDPGAKPMTLDSLFDLASISKIVGTTSGALLMLEQGKIHVDDLVSEYIPGFEQNGKDKVTIRELMTHTSGLKAYESYEKVEKTRADGETHADALIADYAALKPSYPPGTGYVYSCLNFQTTARIVENVSGQRLEDLVKKNVYAPLGMNDTVYTLSPEQEKRTVPTLKNADGSLLVGVVHDPLARYHGKEFHCPGNAGLFSTATDVATYCEMILNGGELDGVRIYKPETIQEATSVQSPAAVKAKRGLGWDVYTSDPYVTPANHDPDTLVVGHTGYTGTLIWLDKNTKTYAVFFTNRVFPDDASKPDGQLSISKVRRMVADAVLRHLPEYKDYYASLASTDEHKTVAAR